MENAFCLGKDTETTEGSHGHCENVSDAERQSSLYEKMKPCGKFQGSEKQAERRRAGFPVMPGESRQNGKQENITAQAGDRLKTIHDGGIQQCSRGTGFGWLHFWIL